MESLKGRLLVASPLLRDPNFVRAVVLVLAHEPEGALGVVLNRPGHIPVGAVLPRWTSALTGPDELFVGGPVGEGMLIGLGLGRAGLASPRAGWEPLLGPLGTIDLELSPDDVGLDELRIFSGYSGWGEGQLEAELTEGSWFVLDADPRDAFTRDPARLWEFVLRRQGGPLSFVSTFPQDPTLN